MNRPAIIMDNGTGYTKLGYAGQGTPTYVIPTCMAGDTVFDGLNAGLKDLEFYIGDEAIRRSAQMPVHWPIRHGVIEDWSTMERFWEQCIFKYMRADPEDHFFMLTEPPLNPPENREQMAEIMFETFGAKGLHIAVQAVLALCASWPKQQREVTTGTVVDIGDGVTHIIPVIQGCVIGSAVKSIPIAGRDITTFIQAMQRTRERNIPSGMAMEVARVCKERYSYLCRDLLGEFRRFDTNPAEMIIKHNVYNPATNKTFTIDVGPERFLAPEVFFNPSILSSQHTVSLPQIVDESIQACPVDCRRELYANIVLSGGSTTFENFGKRLQRDVREICQERITATAKAANMKEDDIPKMDVKVCSHSRQTFAVFYGGSLLANLPQFESNAHTREEYEEYGSSICRTNSLFGNM